MGDSCRGKTTLALKLAKKLEIPHFSTDDFFYEVKFTKKREKQESIDKIIEIYKKDKWIVEGTTRHLLEPGVDSADIIIYLEYPNVAMQWVRLIQRHIRRRYKSRTEESETVGGLLGLMKHVLYKKYGLGYKKGTVSPQELVRSYKHKVVTLSSFREINTFVDSL